MGFGPIRYTLMVNAQLATNSPQIHSIHIQLHGLHTKFFIVRVGLFLRRIFTTTQITPVALAPRRKLAYLVLLFFTATFWTFHPPILPILSPLPIGYSASNQTGMMIPLWIPTRKNRAYIKARAMVHSYIDSLIEQRRSLPEADWPNDLLTRLMQARDEETGEPMSESLLRDESITTFFAGHETTARTLTYTWYALASNPHVAEKLHQELDTVLGDRTPTLEDLHHLPYTLQVIKEVLRLYPPAPFYIRDSIAEDELGGFNTQGLPVLMSPYYTHRHPEFWENPLEFNPDRWTPEQEADRHPYAYHPFAAGQRVCIGNNFSLLESHILLSLLAREYAPRMVPGFTPHFIMGGTLATSNGFPMIIERRS